MKDADQKTITLQSHRVLKARTKLLCLNIQQKNYLTQILAEHLFFLTSCDLSIARSFKGKL